MPLPGRVTIIPHQPFTAKQKPGKLIQVTLISSCLAAGIQKSLIKVQTAYQQL